MLPAMLDASHASVSRENAGMPTSRGCHPGEVGIGVLVAPCSAQHRFCRGPSDSARSYSVRSAVAVCDRAAQLAGSSAPSRAITIPPASRGMSSPAV